MANPVADALADGDLAAALALQRELVADAPTPAAQLLLAELLLLGGELRPAWEQLRQIDSEHPDWPASRRQFAATIRGELRRRHLRRTRLNPTASPHFRARWAALKAMSRGDFRLALTAVDRADRAAPEVAGHVDGREFGALRDADDVFASVLEVFLDGEYVWVPWADLKRLRLDAVRGVLDQAYRPAQLTWHDGATRTGVVPLTYVGSHAADGAFALGLDTDFATPDGGPVRGVGAKVLLMDDADVPMGDCRQWDFAPVTPG